MRLHSQIIRDRWSERQEVVGEGSLRAENPQSAQSRTSDENQSLSPNNIPVSQLESEMSLSKYASMRIGTRGVSIDRIRERRRIARTLQGNTARSAKSGTRSRACSLVCGPAIRSWPGCMAGTREGRAGPSCQNYCAHLPPYFPPDWGRSFDACTEGHRPSCTRNSNN